MINMNRKIFIGALILGLSSFASLETIGWSSDKAHSRLGFTINHMGINDVHGEFKSYTIKATSPDADFQNATLQLTADVNSISTGIEMRDNHLKTPDFLNTEKFPEMTFLSKVISKVDASTYTVTGILTMHGISKEVTFTAKHNGTVKNNNGKRIAGFNMYGSIKRSDFSVGDQSGGLSDEVKLNADIEIVED